MEVSNVSGTNQDPDKVYAPCSASNPRSFQIDPNRSIQFSSNSSEPRHSDPPHVAPADSPQQRLRSQQLHPWQQVSRRLRAGAVQLGDML